MQLLPMQIYATESVEKYLYCYLMVRSQATDLFILLTNVCKRGAVYIRVHTHVHAHWASLPRKFRRHVCKANLIYRLQFQNIL